MTRYNWLLRKQRKAIAVFENARRSLEKLCVSIQSEVLQSNERITELQDSVREEKDAISFLSDQLAQTQKRVANIAAIIDPV